MKKNALTFSFQKLWNSEYPLVIERILDVVKKYKPEELHLKKSYDRLNGFRETLSQIQVQSRASGITNIITETDELRDRLTAFIFKQINNYKILDIAPYTEKAKTLSTWAKKFGTSITKENYTAQTEKTASLIEEIESNNDLQTAFATLHLTDVLTQLKAANTRFEELFRSRNEEISKIPEIDVRELRKKIDEATTKLLSAIIFCKEEHEDKDYKPLINELSELLQYHKSQIKARAQEKKSSAKNIKKEEGGQ